MTANVLTSSKRKSPSTRHKALPLAVGRMLTEKRSASEKTSTSLDTHSRKTLKSKRLILSRCSMRACKSTPHSQTTSLVAPLVISRQNRESPSPLQLAGPRLLSSSCNSSVTTSKSNSISSNTSHNRRLTAISTCHRWAKEVTATAQL